MKSPLPKMLSFLSLLSQLNKKRKETLVFYIYFPVAKKRKKEI